MKNYKVTQIVWAQQSDYKLPLYFSNLNKHFYKSVNSWVNYYKLRSIPGIRNNDLYTFVNLTNEKIYDYEAIKKKINQAILKVGVSIAFVLPVGDKGLNYYYLKNIESDFGVKIPETNSNTIKFNKGKTLLLGFLIEKSEKVKDVAIIIPHWESYMFLEVCIDYILKYQSKNSSIHIYIIDDFSEDGSWSLIQKKYLNKPQFTLCRVKRRDKKINADVGYLLDIGVRMVKEQYVVMLDTDCLPINKKWLDFPLWIIDNFGCSSVGFDSSLSSAYLHLNKPGSWLQPSEMYFPAGGFYINDWFSVTNNLYRVMKTRLAKIASEQIGFSRKTLFSENKFVNKLCIVINNLSKDKRIVKTLMNLNLYSLLNPRYPYLPYGCDNGVAVNHFLDINYFGSKFNIPLTGYVGVTPHDGTFGQNLSGLVFHFALSTRALSRVRREVNLVGDDYSTWIDKLKIGPVSDVLSKMITKSFEFKDSWYWKNIKAEDYKREYEYINELVKLSDVYYKLTSKN